MYIIGDHSFLFGYRITVFWGIHFYLTTLLALSLHQIITNTITIGWTIYEAGVFTEW